MLPLPSKPAPNLSPEEWALFREWRDSAAVKAHIKILQDDIETQIQNLLDTFKAQSELDVKLTLNTIKTKRELIVCLMTPPHPQK
jgi:hypothetical protein